MRLVFRLFDKLLRYFPALFTFHFSIVDEQRGDHAVGENAVSIKAVGNGREFVARRITELMDRGLIR